MQTYTLYKNFLDVAFIEEYVAAVKKLNELCYTPENLENHSAYFSDKKPGRESYAYALANTDLYLTGLPCIHSSLIRSIDNKLNLATKAVSEKLGIATDSRFLFNIQMYYQSSAPVPKHFDGELMDFTVNPDHSLDIKKGIRPGQVAVLTLVNDVNGGGTRIYHSDGSSEVIQASPGDLLVFNNIECWHGADSFEAPTVKRQDGLVRMTIGWRSLDTDCVLYENGNITGQLTTKEANNLHRQYLSAQWPKKFEEFNGKAAF